MKIFTCGPECLSYYPPGYHWLAWDTAEGGEILYTTITYGAEVLSEDMIGRYVDRKTYRKINLFAMSFRYNLFL